MLTRRRQWPQLTVGGKLGPARAGPEQVRWERPDAERKPNASVSRSSLREIATVGRVPNCDGKRLRPRHGLLPYTPRSSKPMLRAAMIARPGTGHRRERW